MMEYLLQVPSLMRQKLGPNVIIPRPSLAPVFRQAITARLEKIQKGQLVLKYPDGRVQSFGSALGPSVEMSITSDNFWGRVVLLGDLVSVTPSWVAKVAFINICKGFGQAFMLGYVTTPDLVALLQV